MNEHEIAALLARYPNSERPDGSIICCPARLSWLSLDKPSASQSRPDDMRFRATLLFPKAADLTILRNTATSAAVALWGNRVQAVASSPAFKKPLLPQDAKAGKYDGYEAGAFRANVTTKRKPPVFGLDMVALDPADANAVYAGMWARVKITVRAYDQHGGTGVAFDLVSIQKVADDAAFGGNSVDAIDGFGPATAAPPQAAAAGAPAAALF